MTLANELHNSKLHKEGFDSACPMCTREKTMWEHKESQRPKQTPYQTLRTMASNISAIALASGMQPSETKSLLQIAQQLKKIAENQERELLVISSLLDALADLVKIKS